MPGDEAVKGMEIRERIHSDHAMLRAMLDEIEEFSERFEQGDEAVGDALRERGTALYACFIQHLDLEDAILAPALRTAGPDGERIAARLAHEHHEQRELIGYLLGRLDQQRSPTLLVARELRHFAEYLRQDMQHEESTMLDDGILCEVPALGEGH
jgi:hemerythrin-like domain-containing protein